MPDLEFISAVSDFIRNMTIEVSYSIVIILLARFFTKKFLSAGIRRLFWLIIFVPCLVPWSFSIPLNIPRSIPESNIHPELLSVSNEPELSALPEFINEIDDSFTASNTDNNAENHEFHLALLREPQAILVAIWITGMVGLLTLSCYRNIKNSRMATSNAEAVPSWVQEIFLQCRNRLDIKPWPVLIITSNIASPSLMGAIRPYILLPKDIINEKDPDQLRHILLHELSHLKQGDIWISWCWTFLNAIQWFNPLLWWAGRLMYLDREMSCDEKVLKCLKPSNHQSYGSSLIDLFQKINNPNRYPSLASIVEKKTNFERRLLMINRYKPNQARQSIAGLFIIAAMLAVSLTSFASVRPKVIAQDKAELIGRVEHFFMNNFRDITARKSLQWSDVTTDGKGNLSIRYNYEALIWDKDWKIMNQVFTFDNAGNYIKYDNVTGFPKNKIIAKADTTTKKGMIALVEKFLSRNWRDITAKENIQWGLPLSDRDGNVSIRCSFEATIHNKDKAKMDKVFTFKPDGQFVSVKDFTRHPRTRPVLPTVERKTSSSSRTAPTGTPRTTSSSSRTASSRTRESTSSSSRTAPTRTPKTTSSSSRTVPTRTPKTTSSSSRTAPTSTRKTTSSSNKPVPRSTANTARRTRDSSKDADIDSEE